MALTAKDKQEMAEMIAAMMGSKSDTSTSSDESTPKAATGTTRKAAEVRRNLDPVEVTTDGPVSFVVIASNRSGPLSKGARVVPHVDGKRYQSLDSAMLEALAGDGVIEQVRDAIETVDKRAKLGAHVPVKSA